MKVKPKEKNNKIKILTIGVNQYKDMLYQFSLKNEHVKVTLINIEADRNEYLGTFVNVKYIELVGVDAEQCTHHIANMKEGICLGRKAYRVSWNLVVEVDASIQMDKKGDKFFEQELKMLYEALGREMT